MPSDAAPVLATWLIGSDPSCDLVVAEATVSARHCRLSRFPAGYTLEDLGSTNGTFVDGERLPARQPRLVTEGQRITLGLATELPWPAAGQPPPAASGPREIRIGRSPDSDVVLDYPVISWNHARIVDEGGRLVLEDVGSRNGTAINAVQNRINRAPLRRDDDVYFGSYKIPAARLLAGGHVVVGQAAFESVSFARDTLVIGRDPQCDHPIDHPMVSWHHARLVRAPEGIDVEDLGSLNGTFVEGVRITARTRIAAGQEIALGSVRFRLLPGGALQRRDNQGNVSIQAVEVAVNAPDGTRLLDPVSLTVYPSELVALMGPAGAGKTTFLKALNGYSPPAHGRVLFNGADLYRYYDLFRQQMGYVPQDDIVHAQLTVREALYFSAKLRTDLSDGEIETRIDATLDALGILDRKGSIIGSPERKVLSGGQRKRVNIALELISDTPVLFLDEPTSGLSSYDAAGVVELLKRLSLTGKTIVATIHQPSIDVFRKFDNLIMISRDTGRSGSLVYFGPAYPDSIQFFRQPPTAGASGATGGDTAAELAPEMLLTGLAAAQTAAWTEHFSRSRYRTQFVDSRAAAPAAADATAAAAPRRRADLRQPLTLLRRSTILKARDRAQLVILLLQAPLFATLIVLVYGAVRQPPAPGAGDAPPDVMQAFAELGANLAGIEFLMVVAAIWFGCNNAARDIVGEWTVYQRERMVNLRLPAYVGSKFAMMTALSVVQCLMLLTIVYVFCDLEGRFAATGAMLVLASLVGAGLGLAISARSSTTESAIALLPVVLLPVIALGGGIRPIYKIPEPARTISYAVPSRWAFEANLVGEAAARPCGYLPGLPPWDSCPSGGAGVDAATVQFPEGVVERDGIRHPAPPEGGAARRHSFGQSMAALGGMLVLLLTLAGAFLKMRDVH